MSWRKTFRWPTVRRLLRWNLARAAGGVLVLAGLLWIVSATGLGMSLVVPAALGRAAPDGWTVEVGRVEGAWHSRVRVHDLKLEGPEASASIEEIFLDYRVLPLFSRRISLPEVRVVRPEVRADLTRTPAGAVSRADPEGGGLGDLLSGSPLGEWALELAQLDVREARATLLRHDGTYQVSQTQLTASAELGPVGVRLSVDTLVAQVVPPASADSLAPGRVGSGRLVLAARLENGLLDVRTLSFESPRSRLAGSGRLLLAAVPGLVDSVDFQLVADPLDLRDLPVPVPEPWADRPWTTIRVVARGAVDSMVVEAEAEGPGETAVEARATLRTPADTLFEDDAARAPTVEVSADIRGDLSPWSLGPLSGGLTAELELRLDSLSLRAPASAHAMLIHRPEADTLGGLMGRDLRVDLDLTRKGAPSRSDPGRTGPDAGAALEAAARIYSAASGRAGWREVGVLRASGTERRADWQVDLDLAPGSLSGRGSAERVGERMEVVVDRLALDGFDASALAGRFPATDVTALLEGRLAGATIDELSGIMALQVSPSSFGDTPVESATLRARLDPGVIEGALMAGAAGREVSSDFLVTLTESRIEATLSQLRVSTPRGTTAADTAATARTALEVRGRATGTWSLGDARRGTVSLTLDSALVAGLPMSDGTLEGRLVGDSVLAQASLRVQDVLAAPASVDASLRARGTTLADMVGRLEVAAVRSGGDGSAAGPERADSLLVVISASEPGRLVLDGRLLPAEGGRVSLDGRASLAADASSFDATVTGAVETPAELLRGAAIDTLAVDVSGARTPERWDALSAHLLVRGVEWRGVTGDSVRLVVRADADAVRLDTLVVESEVLRVAGGGVLPRSRGGSGKMAFGAALDLRPLADVVEVELPLVAESGLTASVSGATDSIDVETSIEAAAFSYGSIEIAGIRMAAQALFEPPFEDIGGLRRASAEIELDAIELPDTDVQNLTASLSGTPDSLRLDVDALVDGERAGELEVTIDPRPDGRTARIERLELQLDEDEWELAAPARITYGDGYSLREFQLEAGEQAILVDGGVTAAGALDLSVAMDSTDVGIVSDLLGLPRLDGWLGGRVSLEGTVEAPRGTADLRAGFHLEGRSPTTASLRLEADGSRVVTDVELQDPNGGTLALDGSLPISALRPADAAAEGALDLRVRADAFDVSSAVAFVDSALLETLEGQIDAGLTVGGSLDAPLLQGPLQLSGGRARLPQLGVTWEEIGLGGHGDGSQLVVDSARVRAGSGYLAMAGRATLRDAVGLDLDVRLGEFQAIQNEEYHAAVSGDLHVGGEVMAPVVEGDIRVASLDVFVGERTANAGLEDIELTEEDLETLRRRFGYVPVPESDEPSVGDLLTADLTVELSRDSWLRKRAQPDMAVPFTGDVEVRIRPHAEPDLQGTVTTIADRGYIRQFGKRFLPREGTVTLDGPPDSARVDLSATYTIPSHTNAANAEATIVLNVQGTQDSLSLTLSSEPPMESADIVSYIATGRPAASSIAIGDGDADQADDGQRAGLAEAGAGLAIGRVVGAVERAAQEGVGLDVVEIRREGIRGATLVAGKYLSPSLYVGFAQPVTRQEGDGLSLGDEGESGVEIEYQALRGLLLNIEGSDSALRIFLRGRLAY